MITYQYEYTSSNELENYLRALHLSENNRHLFQIYSNKCTSDFQEIYTTITNQISNAQVVGAKTNGLIYNGKVCHDKTIIVLSVFERVHFYLISQDKLPINEISLPASVSNAPLEPSYIQMISTLSINQNHVLLDTFNEILPQATVGGGIINIDPSTDEDVCLFENGHFFEHGYIGVIFKSPCLDFHDFYTTHIISIGREHKITKAHGHYIESIDHIPARQFYKSYLGVDVGQVEKIGHKFPLVLHHDRLALPTTVTLAEQQDVLYSEIPVHINDQITLGYGNPGYFGQQLRLIKSHLPSIPCQYLVTFSSKIQTNELLRHISDYNIHLPFFGILTDYEFIHENKKSYISTHSTSIVTMASDSSSMVSENSEEMYVHQTQEEIEQSILLKLVENTSKELNTLNKTLEKMVIEKADQLTKHYYQDSLTHLPNLNKLTEDIATGTIQALCLIDISAFININNFYGTVIGNKVLIELANLITKYDDQNAFKTYRIHSDIFAVVTYDSSLKVFTNRMRLLQKKIHKHCFVNKNHKIYINTTFAISSMQLSLYENSSMTLEHAKSEKISFLVYNENLKIEESIISNLTWTSIIRNAIEEDRIIPFFQPIYNNSIDKIDRFEVLMRLVDEDGNIVSPFQFLPIAKKAGLYNRLTKIIIMKSFEYFTNKDYKFSINLSVEDIYHDLTRQFIYNQLMAFSRPHNVIFELVESEGIENYTTMSDFIKEVKRYGAEIAIDDFGTGFSNFNYLHKLDVDCIKIDGSIIQQMLTEPSAELVAETIVSFASKLGITTVAEYVSDEAIFNKTKEIGIGYSQGYFIARPGSDIVM